MRLSQIAAREDNRLYFDQGWGKDLTDSLVMQHKQRIREGVKPTGVKNSRLNALLHRTQSSRIRVALICV
jgi:hypothetical protein